MLQRLALLGAAGVRRQQRRDLGQHGEQGGRGIGPRPHRRTELAQEQHLRGFARLVGGLPVPDAIGVGTAEARQHGGAQHLGIDGAAAFEIGQQQPCGGNEGGGGIKQRRCGRERGRGGEETVHGEMSGRAGNGKSRRGALSQTPPAQTRSGQTLTLDARHAAPAPSWTSPGEDGLRRHHGAHLGRQRRRIVEQPQRREMIAPAGVVAPAFACAEQDAVFRTHGALRHLDVNGVMM